LGRAAREKGEILIDFSSKNEPGTALGSKIANDFQTDMPRAFQLQWRRLRVIVKREPIGGDHVNRVM